MTPEQFCYWLQGYLELTNAKEITEVQILIINDHLKEVFDKKTPDRNDLLRNELLKRVPNALDKNTKVGFTCSNETKTYC